MMPAPEYDPMHDQIEWLAYDHLPEPQRQIVKDCHDLGAKMLAELPRSDQLYIGLQKLIEAKDAFVRASIADIGLSHWISQAKWKRGAITEVP